MIEFLKQPIPIWFFLIYFILDTIWKASKESEIQRLKHRIGPLW